MSSAANHYVMNIIGGFVSESRGEVLIKGKGIMSTYFLLGTKQEEATGTMYEEFQQTTARKDSM